ncbi:MAG: hypothetical protein M3416_09965 [Acidobacteriota bacterium]|nr:hypothetical protein [Acidobacteriota bacterium]
MRQRLSLAAGLAAALIAVTAALACSPFRQAASLHVEARVEPAPGVARPSAGATVYLLDDDLIRLAMAEADAGDPVRAGVHREHPRLRILAGLMNARRFSAYPLGPDVKLLLEQSRPLWEPHVLRAERADGRGRAAFVGLAPGAYWLMCLDERDGRVAFWNLRLVLGRGANEVTLDAKNALTVSDAGPAR